MKKAIGLERFNGPVIVLNMQHDIMKKLCGRNTHKFFSILTKIEAEKYKTPFLDN